MPAIMSLSTSAVAPQSHYSTIEQLHGRGCQKQCWSFTKGSMPDPNTVEHGLLPDLNQTGQVSCHLSCHAMTWSQSESTSQLSPVTSCSLQEAMTQGQLRPARISLPSSSGGFFRPTPLKNHGLWVTVGMLFHSQLNGQINNSCSSHHQPPTSHHIIFDGIWNIQYIHAALNKNPLQTYIHFHQ